MDKPVLVRVTAEATATETWRVPIPADTPDEQLGELAFDRLLSGAEGIEFVGQDVRDERDRALLDAGWEVT